MINAPTSSNKISNVDCSSNYQLLKENTMLLNSCNGVKTTDPITNATTCTGGSNHITRSANTNVSRSYYRNYSKYLQAKCKSYEQNSSIGSKTSDENVYNSTMCHNNSESCKKPIVYKPNNAAFLTQGAVSSSANTLRKRNRAITNNGQSLMTAYGRAPVYKRAYLNSDGSAYNIYYIKGDLDKSKNCQSALKSCRKA